MSPLAREFMGSDIQQRYPNYDDQRYYFGNKYIEEIEEIAHNLIGTLFQAKGVELHVSSGSMASQAAILSLGRPNDRVMELGPRYGGFSVLPRLQTSGLIRLRPLGIPFSATEMNIDTSKTISAIEHHRPAIVILGAGTFLFPHPTREISEACQHVGAKLVYDGAHVLGLVAGNRFEDPLREGVDLLVGSTHKTFPGPQNGIILSDSETGFERLRDVIHNGLVSNHHAHAIAALAVVAAEMQVYGEAYAKQTIENAKALGRALDRRGVKILCANKDYTQSHMIVADVTTKGGGTKAGQILENSGIVVTKIGLPMDRHGLNGLNGLRIGLQELTRLGMTQDEMEEIAGFFERALVKKEKTSDISRDVAKFRRNYQKLHFAFDRSEAYQYFRFSRATPAEFTRSVA
jgi:glycine hydroxymethyltransferase